MKYLPVNNVIFILMRINNVVKTTTGELAKEKSIP